MEAEYNMSDLPLNSISDSVWTELQGFSEYLNTISNTSAITTALNNTAPTTFPRLQELPVELQMQIWSWALLEIKRPIKTVGKHYRAWVFAPTVDEWFGRQYSCFLTSPFTGNELRFAGWNDRLWALKDVCRLSRMLLLERWKRQIVEVGESFLWETEFKAESLVVLGEIIEGLRETREKEVKAVGSEMDSEMDGIAEVGLLGNGD